MKEKINEKINEIVDFIISKPASEITLDDYTIIRDVRTFEESDDNRERMARIVAMANGFSPAVEMN